MTNAGRKQNGKPDSDRADQPTVYDAIKRTLSGQRSTSPSATSELPIETSSGASTGLGTGQGETGNQTGNQATGASQGGNQTGNETQGQEVRISQPEIVVEESEKAEAVPPKSRKKKTVTKDDAKSAQQTAALLVIMLDGVVCQFYGQNAAMNENERGMIEPALGRILARMPTKYGKQVQELADPVMLGLGLVMWFVRVQAEHPKPRPTFTAEQAAAVNGVQSDLRPNGSTPIHPEIQRWFGDQGAL